MMASIYRGLASDFSQFHLMSWRPTSVPSHSISATLGRRRSDAAEDDSHILSIISDYLQIIIKVIVPDILVYKLVSLFIHHAMRKSKINYYTCILLKIKLAYALLN